MSSMRTTRGRHTRRAELQRQRAYQAQQLPCSPLEAYYRRPLFDPNEWDKRRREGKPRGFQLPSEKRMDPSSASYRNFGRRGHASPSQHRGGAYQDDDKDDYDESMGEYYARGGGGARGGSGSRTRGEYLSPAEAFPAFYSSRPNGSSRRHRSRKKNTRFDLRGSHSTALEFERNKNHGRHQHYRSVPEIQGRPDTRSQKQRGRNNQEDNEEARGDAHQAQGKSSKKKKKSSGRISNRLAEMAKPTAGKLESLEVFRKRLSLRQQGGRGRERGHRQQQRPSTSAHTQKWIEDASQPTKTKLEALREFREKMCRKNARTSQQRKRPLPLSPMQKQWIERAATPKIKTRPFDHKKNSFGCAFGAGGPQRPVGISQYNITPGPGHFGIAEMPRKEGVKFNLSVTPSVIELAVNAKKDVPGPGLYDISNDSRLKPSSGGAFNLSKPMSELDWAIKRAKSQPGVGAYGVPELPKKDGVKFQASSPASELDIIFKTAGNSPGVSRVSCWSL
jgi:hypothetical protein